MTATDTHHAIEAVWRMEAPRLIAGLTRIVRDIGLAEDLAQDALVAALEQWPAEGIPRNPGAWLMAAAKNRELINFAGNNCSNESTTRSGTHSNSSNGPCRHPKRGWTTRLATIYFG